METIRTGVATGVVARRNYIVKGFDFMVRKVESNSQRVTIWLTIGTLTVSILLHFVPYVKNTIIDNAVQSERRLHETKMLEGQTGQTKALTDGLKALQEEMRRTNDNNQAIILALINRMPTLSRREKDELREQLTNGRRNMSGANSYFALPKMPATSVYSVTR